MNISNRSLTLTIMSISLLLLIFCDRGAAVEKEVFRETIDNEISHSLENTLTALSRKPNTVLAGESIYAPEMLRQFYSRRNYLPVWSNSNDLFRANQLTATIADVREQGLNSELYHLNVIKNLIHLTEQSGFVDLEVLTALDLLLTDAFFKI
jgi:murein L,D-transpeptidase YcbB/YkuD